MKAMSRKSLTEYNDLVEKRQHVIMYQAIRILKDKGIRNVANLDAYRKKHDKYNTRYNVLSAIVGKDIAMWLLDDLAVKIKLFRGRFKESIAFVPYVRKREN